jgi:hypothetical protein
MTTDSEVLLPAFFKTCPGCTACTGTTPSLCTAQQQQLPITHTHLGDNQHSISLLLMLAGGRGAQHVLHALVQHHLCLQPAL